MFGNFSKIGITIKIDFKVDAPLKASCELLLSAGDTVTVVVNVHKRITVTPAYHHHPVIYFLYIHLSHPSNWMLSVPLHLVLLLLVFPDFTPLSLPILHQWTPWGEARCSGDGSGRCATGGRHRQDCRALPAARGCAQHAGAATPTLRCCQTSRRVCIARRGSYTYIEMLPDLTQFMYNTQRQRRLPQGAARPHAGYVQHAGAATPSSRYCRCY